MTPDDITKTIINTIKWGKCTQMKNNKKTRGGQNHFLFEYCMDGAMINVCAWYGHTECVIYHKKEQSHFKRKR